MKKLLILEIPERMSSAVHDSLMLRLKKQGVTEYYVVLVLDAGAKARVVHDQVSKSEVLVELHKERLSKNEDLTYKWVDKSFEAIEACIKRITEMT